MKKYSVSIALAEPVIIEADSMIEAEELALDHIRQWGEDAYRISVNEHVPIVYVNEVTGN